MTIEDLLECEAHRAQVVFSGLEPAPDHSDFVVVVDYLTTHESTPAAR